MVAPPRQGAGSPPSPEISLPLGEYMSGVQDRVNQNIDEYLDNVEPNLRGMFAYALGGENPNRLRPALAYTVGDTLGTPRENIDSLALATEFIHSASLVMDDLPAQDNSNLRRGREALHIKYGVGPAETLTAAMVAKASILLVETDAQHNLRGRLASPVMELVVKMCSGQIDDLQSVGQPPDEVTEEELDEINWLKTGTAIDMSLSGAVMIGKPPGTEAMIKLMRQYSRHMGIAYQAQDDLLDIASTSEETGKPTGLDTRNKKPTYLSVIGEAATREKAQSHGESALSILNDFPEDYDPVKLQEITKSIIGKKS